MKTLASDRVPLRELANWREPFARWLNSRCVRDPRCSGGVGCLHLAFCEWTTKHDYVPCNRFTFECLLRESGFLIDEVAGVVLVFELIFQDDFEAVKS